MQGSNTVTRSNRATEECWISTRDCLLQKHNIITFLKYSSIDLTIISTSVPPSFTTDDAFNIDFTCGDTYITKALSDKCNHLV